MAHKNEKTELNRAFFDDEAEGYDAKHEKTAEEIMRRVAARRDFIGIGWIEDEDEDEDDDEDDDEDAEVQNYKAEKSPSHSVRVLDYACGTGNMSRAFAPYTTQCVGIDLSEKMVQVYNTRARNQGLDPEEMSAYHGNLCIPKDPTPAAFQDPVQFFNFDMAIVGLGFHHFDDPQLAASRLVARLKPGGVLVILDFLPHTPFSAAHDGQDNDHQDHHSHAHSHGQDESQGSDKELEKHGHGHDHSHSHSHGHGHAAHTVTHHGFSEEQITRIFTTAGAAKDFAIDKLGQVTMGRHMGKRELFMARGTKP
ncbi:S-adenosyl-L-methionine-dependent methyltransferase [Coniella lustricola]|uniref:S-adenosyl-L-methionine-dependent methyltransferase n=1 Tax=Coniella lustricola TaxID=2025994 RepID=A0A2T3ALQ8_9PEZI|nr:S-adenosyl-L-methionine-dependent methyltransferase [Coniella lustricola]